MIRALEPFLAAAAFAAFVSALGPWWAAFELDPDEGFNLMKAALLAGGHTMFTEIWSDQPPVFTYALAAAHALFGAEIWAARGLVLLFACALTAALFITVRASAGRAGAWAACAVLTGGFLFQSLSVSVMIGLPAVALAMCAFAVLAQMNDAEAEAPRASVLYAALVLSGALMALSLQTKLFTAAALPAGILAAALAGGVADPVGAGIGPVGAGNTHWRLRARRAGVWLAALGAVWAAVSLASGLDPAAHLIAPHTDARLMDAFRYDGGPGRFWSLLTAQPQYLAAGAAGAVLTAAAKDKRVLVPLLWAGFAAAALVNHKPLWPHQMLLVLIPLAWLAGGIGPHLSLKAWRASARPEAWRASARPEAWRTSRLRAGTAALAAAVIAVCFVWQAPVTHGRFSKPADPLNAAAVNALKERAAGVRWVITDKPLDAWYAGLLTPPPLAVLSLKRVKGGALTHEQTAGFARAYKPGLVSYRRMYMGKPMAALMKQNCAQVTGLKRHALFVCGFP